MRFLNLNVFYSFLLIFLIHTRLICQVSIEGDSIFIANWNVENLFDNIDNPLINDSEFLPESPKQWTEDRLERKLINLKRVINYMNNGCGPDILGLQEIENINILKHLVYRLRDRDYIIAHRDSPDERGIDAALIYDRSIFGIVSLDTIRVNLPTGYPTRYILHVTLNHKRSNSNIHLFVNHWPSRRSGEKKSEPNRWAAAKTLKAIVDSLFKLKKEDQIIIMGDFNDEPENSSIKEILNAKEFFCQTDKPSPKTLFNLSYDRFKNGEGSYLFGTDWNMLDQIIISSSLFDGKKLDYKCDSFTIIKPEFMINKEKGKIGGPIPTYSGNIYIGGFSDHFPVGAKLVMKK